MSSLAARSALRTAARSSRTRVPAPLCASSPAVLNYPRASQPQRKQSLQSTRPFSTTMAARSGAPAPSGANPFDEPIQDMATYIHNYKIDSDLAVRRTTLS